MLKRLKKQSIIRRMQSEDFKRSTTKTAKLRTRGKTKRTNPNPDGHLSTKWSNKSDGVKCFKCEEFGHKAPDCPPKKPGKRNDRELMMASVRDVKNIIMHKWVKINNECRVLSAYRHRMRCQFDKVGRGSMSHDVTTRCLP